MIQSILGRYEVVSAGPPDKVIVVLNDTQKVGLSLFGMQHVMHREGVHTVLWQKALLKETPSVSANPSRLGVTAPGLPM